MGDVAGGRPLLPAPQGTTRPDCPCPAPGAPPHPAHSPRPMSTPRVISPAPATPEQGWSPAPLSLAQPCHGPCWARPTHRLTSRPGLGLSPGRSRTSEPSSNLDSFSVYPEVSRVFIPSMCNRREDFASTKIPMSQGSACPSAPLGEGHSGPGNMAGVLQGGCKMPAILHFISTRESTQRKDVWFCSQR